MKRKLTIRTKLAATLAVPLAALASFAALQVRDAYNRSEQVKLEAGLATSATGPTGVLVALENERDYEALRAIGLQGLVAEKNTKFSAQVTARTDIALGNFRTLLGSVGGNAEDNYWLTLKQVGAGLAPLRQQAEDGASRTVSSANATKANAIFDRYTGLIGQLLDAAQRSGATIDDGQLRSGAELLNAIARQSDVESALASRPVSRRSLTIRPRYSMCSDWPTARPRAAPTSTCGPTACSRDRSWAQSMRRRAPRPSSS